MMNQPNLNGDWMQPSAGVEVAPISRSAWKLDDEENVRYFTGLANQFGRDPRALDWGSRESQQLRFSVLAAVGDLGGASILDVGCGQGDFLAWLIEQGIACQYTGIDITPSMIDHCRQRFGVEGFEGDASNESPLHGSTESHFKRWRVVPPQFLVGSMQGFPGEAPHRYDYVVSSGIFAHRHHEPRAFLLETAEAMFARCAKAVALNTLSTWAERRDEGEFHADPADVLTSLRQLTPRVTLRHDYHPRDLTVYLYRAAAR